MTEEPDSLVLRLLRDIRAEMGEMHAEMTDMRSIMATKTELRSEINSLRADAASDMVVLRKDIGGQITGLRRAVVQYHSSVIGHGVLISDLEARVRRVEQHLDLPAIDAH